MHLTFFTCTLIPVALNIFLLTSSASPLSLTSINTAPSLTPRQDFSTIYTGDLCIHPTSIGNTCFFSSYTNPSAGTAALYAFRNTCELMGYNPAIQLNTKFGFASQLPDYIVVTMAEGGWYPSLWYAGRWTGAVDHWGCKEADNGLGDVECTLALNAEGEGSG